MKFIAFVLAVLAIATSAKAGVLREPEVSTHLTKVGGSSTPRPELAGASTPLTEILKIDDIAGVAEIAKAAGEPTHLEDVDADGGVPADPEKEIVRERRLTCDLFSFSSSVVTPNHAACATKCIGMGRKGGHCDGTTCNCRGDKWIG